MSAPRKGIPPTQRQTPPQPTHNPSEGRGQPHVRPPERDTRHGTKRGSARRKTISSAPFSLSSRKHSRTNERGRGISCIGNPPRFFACRIFGLLPESGAPRPPGLKRQTARRWKKRPSPISATEPAGPLSRQTPDTPRANQPTMPRHEPQNQPTRSVGKHRTHLVRTSRQRPDTSRKTGPPAQSANTGHTPREPADNDPTQAAKPAGPLSRQAPDTPRANRPAPGSRFVSG